MHADLIKRGRVHLDFFFLCSTAWERAERWRRIDNKMAHALYPLVPFFGVLFIYLADSSSLGAEQQATWALFYTYSAYVYVSQIISVVKQANVKNCVLFLCRYSIWLWSYILSFLTQHYLEYSIELIAIDANILQFIAFPTRTNPDYRFTYIRDFHLLALLARILS